MVIRLDEDPVRVGVTHNEAVLQGTPLRGLVDRVAGAFEAGAKIVDMYFPVSDGAFGDIYACEWCTVQEFNFPNGSTFKGRPIDIVYSSLRHRNYKVDCSFGSHIPTGAIRFGVKE